MIFGVTLAFFAIMGFTAWIGNRPAPTVTLKTNEWRCITGHKQTDTTYLYVDGIALPIDTSSFVCDHWIRRKTS
jgi:hypothetical protein